MISTDGPTTPSHQLLQLEPNLRIPPNNNNNNGLTDLINTNLTSRLIPKIGSIVKRFSLNYSGEGLVTDRQRVRTVRVGIQFQVQVDSFLNNSQRSRGITRTNSAPFGFLSNNSSSSPAPICDTRSCENVGLNGSGGGQLALDYSPSTSPTLKRNFSSSGNINSTPCLQGDQTLVSRKNCPSDLDLDSSSGVSSLAGSNSQSPVLSRRHSSSLAFHNRINQALNLCRNQLAAAAANKETDYPARRASVQVLRRNSISPVGSPPQRESIMEDSSSYQVLRYFPGSNINSARELSWETAAFEKDVRDRVQWLGDKFSSMRIPPIVSRLLGVGKDYAVENPVTAVLFLAVGLACVLPISIFLGFAVATLLFTFLGFLFVEGTLITVATVVLGGVVLILGLVTLFFLTMGYLGYSTVSQIYSFFTGGSDMKDLLQQIPILGYFFTSSSETRVPVHEDRNGSSHSKRRLSTSSNGFIQRGSNGHGPPLSKVEDLSDEDEAESSDDDSVDETIHMRKGQEETRNVVQEVDTDDVDDVDEVDDSKSEGGNQEVLVDGDQSVEISKVQEGEGKAQETLSEDEGLAQTD